MGRPGESRPSGGTSAIFITSTAPASCRAWTPPTNRASTCTADGPPRSGTAARDYRDESQEALGQVAANISSRQGQFINILTVISAIFLPLTFVTGYFGMNFGVITMDLNKVWLYVPLGILLPAACVAVTLVILQRLIARMGIQSILPARPAAQAEPPGHARPTA